MLHDSHISSQAGNTLAKGRLIWKLLLINLTIIVFVMVIVWISIDTLAAGYFVTLMERYHISPEPAHAMFVDAVHRYLIWACMAAALLAALLSFLMMRRVLSPLTGMNAIAHQIANGNFKGRVPELTTDEVGQLAKTFNRMADSLEKLENLRRNLMIDVAHELRTPLTNMRGYFEALKDGVLSPTPGTLTMLHEETLRLADLVEDVLRLAKADAAKKNFHFQALNLGDLVQEVLRTFEPRLYEKQINISLNLPADLPEISGDRNRLTRAIRNLMDNAARYTPFGGRLTIEITINSHHQRLLMTNTTAGTINDKDLPFIFERFYRSEKSRSREHGGAGIGLSIVKGLIEAHNGTLGAHLKDNHFHIWFEIPVNL